MSLPESPHQAAIAGAFKAKVRPPLAPEAAELVRIYDSTYGSASPGCCPEALAAVLDHIVDNPEKFGRPHPTLEGERVASLDDLAALLRGESP